MITLNSFIKITNLVIKNLESGYFHPIMLTDGRVHDPEHLMSAGPGRNASGETLFGIDRINGAGGLSIYPEWRAFWALIDKAGAKTYWQWLYIPADPLGAQLRELAAKMMFNLYSKNFKTYLSSKAQTIVDSDARLVFNFSYATWNGASYFKKYADLINAYVAKGITNKDTLVDMLVAARTNSSNELIRKTGEKIKSLLSSMSPSEGGIIVGVALLIGLGFFLF